jgi:hypothetical protein
MPITLRSMGSTDHRHKPKPKRKRPLTNSTVVKVNMSNRPKKEWEEEMKKARVNKTRLASEYIVER